MWVLEECVREWSENDRNRPAYETLMADAASASFARSVVDLNASEFGERGAMVAKLAAACQARGMSMPATRGGVVRLVLESLAESYRNALDELQALTGEVVDVIHVVGGGARNVLLNQLTADACRRRVLAGPDEAAALGNLLVQAYALGDLPPGMAVRDAARASTRVTEYLPRAAVERPTTLSIR
jgi:rhamnulokinase